MQQRGRSNAGAAHAAATHPNPVPSPVIGMLVGGTPLGTHSGTVGTVGKAEGVAPAMATIATQSATILEKVVCVGTCAVARLLAPACACFELAAYASSSCCCCCCYCCFCAALPTTSLDRDSDRANDPNHSRHFRFSCFSLSLLIDLHHWWCWGQRTGQRDACCWEGEGPQRRSIPTPRYVNPTLLVFYSWANNGSAA
jgi:hypothetical protein